MRTSVRVTAQGRPYARLKRALATGNPNIALAAAAELPRVDLADALALCLLLREDGERFERAVVRWHARFCMEVPGVGASEAQLALSALRSTARPEYEAGARALMALLERRGSAEATEVAEQWLERQAEEAGSSPPSRAGSEVLRRASVSRGAGRSASEISCDFGAEMAGRLRRKGLGVRDASHRSARLSLARRAAKPS